MVRRSGFPPGSRGKASSVTMALGTACAPSSTWMACRITSVSTSPTIAAATAVPHSLLLMPSTMACSTPGSASMTIQADATKASHVRLHELSQAAGKNTVRWVVGFSDGPKDDKGAPTAVPTTNTEGTDFVLPTTRTWFIFDGYVSDFPFDFATNSVVSTAATVQRTGGSTWQRKST